MKNTGLLFALILTIVISILSCNNPNYDIQYSDVNIELRAPEGIDDYSIDDIILTFIEANTGVETKARLTSAGTIDKELPTGSYSVNLEGQMTYLSDNQTMNSKIKSYKDKISIVGNNLSIALDLFIVDDKASLIIKEIFFTGTQTPENKSYNGDKYIIVYNNSEDTIYADGLIIAQSTFNTTIKRDYTPDVMKEAFTTGDLTMIPGSGKEYPIAPGKQIIIANNAINHLEFNSNSFDLSKADFEIQLLAAINVDNPEVANTINLGGSMTMHNSGFTSYVIARLPEGMTVDEYKIKNYYTYEYYNGGRIVSSSAYKIPNEYIIDAVNLSSLSGFQWIVTDPRLDMGWSYCTKANGDVTRFKKSVLRKVLTTNPDGRIIYQDTNNSTQDFIPEATPSIQQ